MSDWVKDNGVWKQTSGNSQQDLVGTKAEFDAIKDSLPDGSAFDTTDENVGGGSSSTIYKISGTIGSSNGFTKIGNYPQGLDASNTCFVNYMMSINGYNYKRCGEKMIGDTESGRFFFELHEDGVYIYNSNGGRYNLGIDVFLAKVGD